MSKAQKAFTRGSIGITYTGGNNAGNIWLCRFARPPKPRGPTFVFLELHTTGVKTRTMGQENEKQVWSLQVQNTLWKSSRSNHAVRRVPIPDGTSDAAADALVASFYPAGLSYVDSETCIPDTCVYPGDTHDFSWVHPNWAFTAVPRATIQDMTFTLLDGDTQEPMNMFSGAGTQFSMVLSP